VDAVLASAQVVRLSLFPLEVVGDATWHRVGAAPAPRSSALLLGATCPVVVVARPVTARGSVGQAFLLGHTAQGQWCHPQTAARLHVLLPTYLSFKLLFRATTFDIHVLTGRLPNR
jgi:hypothetical protein